MRVYHKIDRIDFEGPKMMLIVDGKKYIIDILKQSRKLAKADIKTKMNFQISPSGYGIHWPEIDEDLSIDGLIGNKAIKSKKLTTKIS